MGLLFLIFSFGLLSQGNTEPSLKGTGVDILAY
jgi:hypothetical protein